MHRRCTAVHWRHNQAHCCAMHFLGTIMSNQVDQVGERALKAIIMDIKTNRGDKGKMLTCTSARRHRAPLVCQTLHRSPLAYCNFA